MPYLSIILFSIALVLSAVNAALFIWLKRRFDRKIALLIQINDVITNNINCIRELFKVLEKKNEYHVETIQEGMNDLNGIISGLNGKISGLELDYQEAQKAANKVNDFGSALANIFDYDPIRAMQRSREKGDS